MIREKGEFELNVKNFSSTEEIERVMRKEYGPDGVAAIIEPFLYLFDKAKGMPKNWQGIDKLRNKNILDLGGGSVFTSDNLNLVNNFDPWLGRMLTLIGAKPIVVDSAAQGSEPFKSIKSKVDEAFFSSLGKDKYDIIHASELFNSPSFGKDENKPYIIKELLKVMPNHLNEDGLILLQRNQFTDIGYTPIMRANKLEVIPSPELTKEERKILTPPQLDNEYFADYEDRVADDIFYRIFTKKNNNLKEVCLWDEK